MIYFIIGNGNICFESHLEIMFLCFQIFLFYISCSTSGSWFMVFLKILVEDIVHSYTVSYNYLWSMSFPCCRDRMNVNLSSGFMHEFLRSSMLWEDCDALTVFVVLFLVSFLSFLVYKVWSRESGLVAQKDRQL